MSKTTGFIVSKNPDPNQDPVANGVTSRELYREMWGSDGEFVIDGNLKSVEYTDKLSSIKVPTLITVGDNDECSSSLSKEMNDMIPASKLVVFPKSGHMTFVDQPELFVSAIDDFLSMCNDNIFVILWFPQSNRKVIRIIKLHLSDDKGAH